MKRTMFLIAVLSILSLSGLNAQTSQGHWLLGISSRYSISPADLGLTIPDMMSIGFGTVKDKSDDGSDSESTKFTSFNLMPKAGYFVIDNLAVGLDVQVGISSMKYADDQKNNGTVISGGPFVRYYFPSDKILPYLEAGGTLGSLNTKDEYNGNTNKNKMSMNSWSFGAGITKSLSEKAALDFMLGYLSTTLKDKDDNDNNARTVIGTIGFKFGIVVFLGNGKKEPSK